MVDGRIVRSVHAFFLFVQENSEGRGGSVRSHFWGRPCGEEITWHPVHRKSCVAFCCRRALVDDARYFQTGALCSTLYRSVGWIFQVSIAPFLTQIVLPRAPGNIVDWVYKRLGVKYSFAAHLRDTGTVSL